MNHEGLVSSLVSTGVLKAPHISDAFRAIDRAHFVPENLQEHTYLDTALPIGRGQTISQPYTVAFMLELLQPEVGDKILDVGSGSGWTTALLTQIVGDRGRVIGTEIVPDVAKFGQSNLARFGFKNADIRLTDTLGAPSEAPFDKILVSAGAREVPQELVDQLKNGGILVMPVENAIVRVQKGRDGKVTFDRHEGFVFVPLKY